jgi:hypothetical protein
MMETLAIKIATAAVNYELSGYGIELKPVLNECEACFDFSYVVLESDKYLVRIKVENINVPENADLTDDQDTSWIWAANFSVCMYEDHYEEFDFYSHKVKHLWIAMLGESGF